VFLLSSVISVVLMPSINCLESQMILGTMVCRKVCVADYKQTVLHCICVQGYFKTRSSSHVIHCFLPNIVTDDGALNIKYLSIYFNSTKTSELFL